MPEAPITLPWTARTARPNPFDPPEVFGRLRAERPLRPMAFADGHIGWLATGYTAVRTILSDTRFSIRRDIAHPPHEAIAPGFGGDPAPPGLFVQMDPPDHTRYRSLLIGEFTAHRVKRLEARIAEVTRDHLDGMDRAGPPADLVQALALPVPSLLICELLGLSPDRRAEFHALINTSFAFGAAPQERKEAGEAMVDFFTPLVQSKRAQPTDDIFSGLVNGSDLTDGELATVGLLLFAAGFETTSSLLALGTFALLQHPEQIAALRADPVLADNAVEELLRYPTGPGGMVRTALEDAEICGELIKEGQTVELLVGAANRDPARFADPDRLDITRSARGQLSFGYGIHQCLGAQLARIELRTVFPALFDRFPNLRLAVAPADVPLRDDSPVFGVKRLPVEW